MEIDPERERGGESLIRIAKNERDVETTQMRHGKIVYIIKHTGRQ